MNSNLYELPFKEAQKVYFNQNRKKMENFLNFIEKIPYQLFKNDPTLEWFRTKYFKGFASLLHFKLGITANIMSIIGLVFAILALIYSPNLILFTIFIFLNLISDGLDGVIARISEERTSEEKRTGELVDVICDTIAGIIFIMAMVMNNYLSGVLGIIFVSVLIPYTFIATAKSIKLIEKAQSIGSRIAIGFGTAILTLITALNIISVEQYASYLTIFFITMSISLGFALVQSFYKFIKTLTFT
jgi:phosphatidylglycerophosphate synthase